MRIGAVTPASPSGGADKLVLRSRAGTDPYIPGSPLKGKMSQPARRSPPAPAKDAPGFKIDEARFPAVPAIAALRAPPDVGVPASAGAQTRRGQALRQEPADSGAAARFLARAAEVERMRNLDMAVYRVKTEYIESTGSPAPRIRACSSARPPAQIWIFELMLNLFDTDDEQADINWSSKDSRTGRGRRDRRQVRGGYGQVKIVVEADRADRRQAYRDEARLKQERGKNLLAQAIVSAAASAGGAGGLMALIAYRLAFNGPIHLGTGASATSPTSTSCRAPTPWPRRSFRCGVR